MASDFNLRPAIAYGANTTDEALRTAAQYGIEDAIVYYGPGAGQSPDFQDYVALRLRFESYGLKIIAIEGGFSPHRKWHDVVFGGPRRDEMIEQLQDQVRFMARAGIPIYGYNWMPNSWGRANPVTIRGGAMGTAYQWDFDKQRRPLMYGEPMSEDNMWDCIEYWIKAITPVAEEEGIRLGIHPEDPPVEDRGGVPGLLRSFDAFKKLMSFSDSHYNAIEFCQGTFSEMPGEDIYEMIEYFAKRDKILYVHFRNVSGQAPSFNEEFINTGYVDMKKAMRTYRDAGYKGSFIDDHCPIMEDDADFPGNLGGYRSRLFAQGYIQGVIDGVTREGDYGGPVSTSASNGGTA